MSKKLQPQLTQPRFHPGHVIGGVFVICTLLAVLVGVWGFSRLRQMGYPPPIERRTVQSVVVPPVTTGPVNQPSEAEKTTCLSQLDTIRDQLNRPLEPKRHGDVLTYTTKYLTFSLPTAHTYNIALIEDYQLGGRPESTDYEWIRGLRSASNLIPYCDESSHNGILSRSPNYLLFIEVDERFLLQVWYVPKDMMPISAEHWYKVAFADSSISPNVKQCREEDFDGYFYLQAEGECYEDYRSSQEYFDHQKSGVELTKRYYRSQRDWQQIFSGFLDEDRLLTRHNNQQGLVIKDLLPPTPIRDIEHVTTVFFDSLTTHEE